MAVAKNKAQQPAAAQRPSDQADDKKAKLLKDYKERFNETLPTP